MMDDFDEQEASSHTTGHLSGHMTSRVEIVGRVSGRRRCIHPAGPGLSGK